MPSKNEIRSAEVAHLAGHAAEFGTMTSLVVADIATVRRREREMVERQVAKHLEVYKASGAQLIMGNGHLIAPKTLEVSERAWRRDAHIHSRQDLYQRRNARRHFQHSRLGRSHAALTHIEVLELDYLPSHLIVIGGVYAGLELSQAYRQFGSNVTIIESGPQLMVREDIDVSQEMRRILTDEGIQVHVAAELLNVQGRSADKVSLLMRTASGEQKIQGSDILVAAGRAANAAGIGLEQTGVKVDGRGYIRINERLETTAAGIWAIGECAGSPQFTHVSEDDFRIIRDNLSGGNPSRRDRLIPYCMFTDPPLAHVGLSEGDAERQGIIVRVARLPADSALRAQATGERQGFMKVLVGQNDNRILGFTMIGAAAGEVMAVVQMAMLADAPYGRLADAILAHPTMAEGLGMLLSNVPRRSLQPVTPERAA
jgi:pyruvate/2-oxoglutarate dehydrogenase complex dihydrolipoamide dehydrogenase (E3) component